MEYMLTKLFILSRTVSRCYCLAVILCDDVRKWCLAQLMCPAVILKTSMGTKITEI